MHGIGYLTYQSILKGEGNLVVSIVTLLMLIFVVCNLLVDMLYAALDRESVTRESREGTRNDRNE